MQEIFGKNGTETAEPVKATISGCLPDWLQGTLLRIGPGMFNVGDTSYNHWFDGMALIHSFTFKDGEVYYQSKFLNSETYRKNMTANRIVVSEFGTMTYPDPCKNIFSRLFSHLSNIIPDFTDNNLINIIKYGEEYYTSSEVNYINKIDPETLNTTGRDNYRNHITLNLATAHPHYDDEGNTFNMGTSIIKLSQPNYVIFKVPAKASGKSSKNSVLKNVQQVCSVPCRSRYYPSYFHSFGLTENYIIFIEQPFKLDIIKLATAYFRGFSWASCLKYDKDDITLIHLVDRKTGKAVSKKFYADALVTFHHINAFEDEDHVVFDIIAYKDSKLYDMFYLSNLMKETDQFIETNKMSSPPVCQRFILPLKPNKGVTAGTNLVKLAGTKATAVQQEDGSVYCKPEALFEGLELPRINYKMNGKMYRYFYGSRVEWSPHPNKIGKVDIVTRRCAEWTEDECFPSEPIFVPSPDAVDEDDGVILSSVISQNPKKSPFLLVLDAKTMKELARATIEHSVHMDIHGIFIPQPDSC
ncbi:beta,beta-carotene 15,15'-dioxygenase [Paramormyrops kingsleyae]|uniref:beta,beta-carotene 15,15'-dioxygenase n=1 Tax=Paramormyrops kingsleyae TaxID=1676925 RepID=UPI003B97581F